eukprot:gb/GECG01016364.1/.p1 GENE.gb/GECG01016364.1/~~gb/GECG01016364.1/.p1  ORF type:complete len:310 (+),score=37.96 gb/GECG01016364.1/:1-930(+)
MMPSEENSQDEIPGRRPSRAASHHDEQDPGQNSQHEGTKQEHEVYVTLMDRVKTFCSQQGRCFSERPAMSVAVWMCAIVNFFAFVCFLSPWHEFTISSMTVFHHLFRRKCCGGDDISLSDCQTVDLGDSGSSRRRLDQNDFDRACIDIDLKGFENQGDAKDAGAAAFFFLLVSFLMTPVLQYFLYRRQVNGPEPHTLSGLYSKVPLMVYSVVCSLLFMLSFSIYVGVLDPSGGDFSFGVAGTIINFLFLIVIALIILFKWDEGEQLAGEQTENPVYKSYPRGSQFSGQPPSERSAEDSSTTENEQQQEA